MVTTMKEIIINDNEAGKRLDKFLCQYLSKASSGFIFKMLRKKNIVLNGKKATGQEKLQNGDIVTLWLSDDTFLKFANDRLAKKERGEGVSVTEFTKAYKSLKGIEVIYENSDVLFVNKPVGILTQKAEKDDVSLNEWLVGYLIVSKAIEPENLITFRPSVSNRLDRNTSGIVICAKTLKGAQLMAEGLKNRTFKKYYRTVVYGILDTPKEITGFLTKDNNTNTVKIRDIDTIKTGYTDTVKTRNSDTVKTRNTDIVKTGNSDIAKTRNTDTVKTGNSDTVNVKGNTSNSSYIETAYAPVAINQKWKLTYLEVELKTGKTHQIRAHLSGIGHPIIGDPKYGDSKLNESYKQSYGLKTQLLHCYRLEFPEGDSFGELAGVVITAPLPKKFKTLIDDKFNL